jgi:hypothetical protein
MMKIKIKAIAVDANGIEEGIEIELPVGHIYRSGNKLTGSVYIDDESLEFDFVPKNPNFVAL